MQQYLLIHVSSCSLSDKHWCLLRAVQLGVHYTGYSARINAKVILDHRYKIWYQCQNTFKGPRKADAEQTGHTIVWKKRAAMFGWLHHSALELKGWGQELWIRHWNVWRNQSCLLWNQYNSHSDSTCSASIAFCHLSVNFQLNQKNN